MTTAIGQRSDERHTAGKNAMVVAESVSFSSGCDSHRSKTSRFALRPPSPAAMPALENHGRFIRWPSR